VDELLHSNEHQQFQNGHAEMLVNSLSQSISCKIRGMLLQLQMPAELWGAATEDIYNCTPHCSLGMESPHYRGMASSPTSRFQLEQVSLYHDMPNPTVADIIERLQSTTVPCDTDWVLHDLQLPATIEEQQPLDRKAKRSGEAEQSISGEPPQTNGEK